MKFVQITAGGQNLYALDELGRVWEHRLGHGWVCLGSVPDSKSDTTP